MELTKPLCTPSLASLASDTGSAAVLNVTIGGQALFLVYGTLGAITSNYCHSVSPGPEAGSLCHAKPCLGNLF